MNQETAHPFSEWIDLALDRLGGKALLANDEFFASRHGMLKQAAPVWIDGKYTPQGKWMDGWESRRRRVPGNDWCIVQLSSRGVLRGVNVNTRFFTGNYPEYFSLEAADIEKKVPPAKQMEKFFSKVQWKEIIPKTGLKGDSDNFVPIDNREAWTHLRLNIYPDGGVARFRAYGEVVPNWATLKPKGAIDLAAIANGGKVITCNDNWYGPKENLILPGRAPNMGDGWETKRKRVPGYDWIIVQLGGSGKITKIEIDTNHYKGNYPESCSVDGLRYPERGLSAHQVAGNGLQWNEILPRTKLKPDHRHFFQKDLKKESLAIPFDYIRLNIFPDGGISRMRVWGILE